MAIDDTGDTDADTTAASARGLGEIGRARAAIAALETSLRVSRVGAQMTDADREVLRGWSGWGPLAKAVGPAPEGAWAQMQGQLLGLLSPTEYSEGFYATPNAFYTPPVLVEGMTRLLADLGFDSGRVLEPGCGAGAFLGHTPPEGVSIDWVGVERDPSTARIAALLHPEATIHNSALEETALPLVDAALGNVPFEDVRVHDPNPEVPRAAKSNLHNYAIWRTVNALKPGGIAVLVTSRYTLDAEVPHGRAAIARQADLLGAIRLPNGALAEGGTQALVDVLVLRKRLPSEPEPATADDVPWVQSLEHPDLPGQRINQVFHAHPEWVLGTLAEDHAPAYGRTVRVDAAEGADLATDFARAASQIVASARDQGRVWQVARHDPAAALAEVPLADAEGRKEGSFHIIDGAAHQVVGGQLAPVMVQDHKASKAATEAAREAARARGEDPRALAEVRIDKGPLSGKALAELTALVGLRDITLELLEAEADHSRPDEDIEPLRQQLNARYDAYVAKFGRLNRATITVSTAPPKTTAGSDGEDTADEQTGLPKVTRKRPQMGGFAADPDYPAVLALEDWDDAANDGDKAAIFHRRLNKPRPRIERAEGPEHALAICLDELGQVDFDRIGQLLDTPADQVPGQLGELVFEDPVTLRWQAREDYLSGEVADKLDQARLAAEHSPQRFGRNVTALEAVQPRPLTPEEITAALGAPWIPPDVVETFCAEVLDERVTITYTPELASFELTRRSVQRSVASTSEFGTSRIDGLRLVELALDGKTPKIKDDTPDDKKIVNQAETQAAQAKQQELAARFGEWVWEDPERAERLAGIYNRKFNSYVNRHYSGEHLTFPGLSEEFDPYPHQRQMVHRAIANPTALCGYAVSGGKTGIMFMQAMKLRELGLARKPMIIVPNHLLEQVARDGKRWFPGAKILMADERQLGKRNDLAQRKLFAARCATGDWDAVVMTHSAFESLPVSKTTQAAYIAEHTTDLENALRARGGKESKQTKALAKALKREQTTLKNNLAADRADDGVTFEQLGVDYLMVDEAHYFKNLHLRAADREISLPKGSNRATDLDNKLAYLRRSNPTGRIATFFTGTPLSNNLVEIYVMQHYLQPERLQQMGVQHLDSWLRTFIRTEARLEVGTDGVSFRMKTRPVAFRNAPELMAAFNAVADVRSQKDLGLARPKARYENITTPATTAQADYIADIARRIDALPTTPAEIDNMLKVCSDGRKAALDPELVGINDPEPGKVAAVVANMAAIYHRTKDLEFPNGKVGGLQLGFLDLGTPNPDAGDQVYGKIRDGLISEGVPAAKIRFIHEASTTAQKAALFAQARSGDVAVLLGSTDKMGVGTNVQDLIVALHHVDAPWRPADVEQRDGRGLRVGNQMLALDQPVEVFKYITEGSFDSYMWQTLERKSWFIAQLFSGSPSREEIEIDLDETVLAASEAKALATGNPLLMEQAEAKQELTRLQRLASSHTRTQRALDGQITTWSQQQDALRGRIRTANNLADTVADRPASWQRAGSPLAGDKVNEVLGELLREQMTHPHRTHPKISYRGIDISLHARQQLSTWQLEARLGYGSYGTVTLKKEWLSAPNQYWRIAKALTDHIDNARERAADLQEHVDELGQRISHGRDQLGKPFPHADQLAAARAKLAAIEARMEEGDPADEQPAELEDDLESELDDDDARAVAEHLGDHTHEPATAAPAQAPADRPAGSEPAADLLHDVPDIADIPGLGPVPSVIDGEAVPTEPPPAPEATAPDEATGPADQNGARDHEAADGQLVVAEPYPENPAPWLSMAGFGYMAPATQSWIRARVDRVMTSADVQRTLSSGSDEDFQAAITEKLLTQVPRAQVDDVLRRHLVTSIATQLQRPLPDPVSAGATSVPEDQPEGTAAAEGEPRDVPVFVGEQHLSDQQRAFLHRVRTGDLLPDTQPEPTPEVIDGEVSADVPDEPASERDTAASSTEVPPRPAAAEVEPESSAPDAAPGAVEPEVTAVPEDTTPAASAEPKLVESPSAPPAPSSAHAAALAWYDAGFSVIRVATDGTKSSVGSWTQYQQQRASREQVDAWFRDGHAGIGLVCGAVSGHAELIEFEGRAIAEGLFEDFRERMIAGGHDELYRRVVEQGTLVRSPSGGLHMLVRVEGGVEGNRKLASRPARDDELTDDERQRFHDKGVWPSRTLAETRGERGMVVAAGSHGSTHESGNPWKLITGSPATVPTLTADERDLLHVVIRSLDQTPAPAPLPEPAPAASTAQQEGLAPGQDFNERGTWTEVLEPHGWTRVRTEGERTYWRRPGKNIGVSAVTGGTAGDYLWVFSTSTELPSDTALSKWRAYAMLEHAGDFSAAAAALRRDGYGSPLEQTQRQFTLRFRQETGVLLLGTDETDRLNEVFAQIKRSGFQPGGWRFSHAIDNGTATPGAWYIRGTRGKPASETTVKRMATTVQQLRRRDFDVVVDVDADHIDPQVRRRRFTMRSSLQELGIDTATTPAVSSPSAPVSSTAAVEAEQKPESDSEQPSTAAAETAEASAPAAEATTAAEAQQEDLFSFSPEPAANPTFERMLDLEFEARSAKAGMAFGTTMGDRARAERQAERVQRELYELVDSLTTDELQQYGEARKRDAAARAEAQSEDASKAASQPEPDTTITPAPAPAPELDTEPSPATENAPAQPTAPQPAAAPAVLQRQLVLHHSQRHGLLLYGTRPTDAIRETLQLARLQGHAVGNWRWNPSALTPDGTQGAWCIPDSHDRLATPVTVRVLHSAAHALRGTGIDVRIDIDPADATEQAQQLLREPPAVIEQAPAGPVARRWSTTEHQQWDTARKIEGSDRSGTTVVEAAEIDGRWALRAQTLIGGHHLDVRISLREEERAAHLARTITAKPQTLPRLARNAVVLGEADALLDGQPLPTTGTAQALRDRLAEPGPYATQPRRARSGARTTATRSAAAALASPTTGTTDARHSRSATTSSPPRRSPAPAASPATNTAMTARSRTL